MPLSVLASSIYAVLRQRTTLGEPRISYRDLVEELGPLAPPNQNLQPQDRRLSAALGELGHACHAAGLPAISAIVVQREQDGLGMPGEGYFLDIHPLAKTDELRISLW